MLVSVPILLGLQEAQGCDDLDVSWWIPVGNLSNASSVDPEATRITITHWPFDSDTPLANSYTICVSAQPLPSDRETLDTHPINDQVQGLAPGLITPIRGNILVLKHSAVSAQMAHMSYADETIVRLIVQQ